METKQAVLPLSAPVSTSILLCFGNRHNHITVFDETVFVSSMTLYRQAVSSYIQRPFCVAKCLLGNPKPLNCIRRMQATRFCKTLLRLAILFIELVFLCRSRCALPPNLLLLNEKELSQRNGENTMPTLEWIGKSKVVNHHQEVPFRVLERQ